MALVKRAIDRGYGAYFVRACDLMEGLRKARAEHNLDRRLGDNLAPKVLVVDESGVWPYDRDAATSSLRSCQPDTPVLSLPKGARQHHPDFQQRL